MATLPPPSALFLREAEIRRGLELLHAGNLRMADAIAPVLAGAGLGRAHGRALYFIARHPDLPVGRLLDLLSVTKQSLGRVLNDLAARGLVETRTRPSDRRQRLLRLTAEGAALEASLFAPMRERLSAAYASAGPEAVAGFWAVLEGLAPAKR